MLPAYASFAWYADLLILEEKKPDKRSPTSNLLQTEIQQYFEQREFRFVEDKFVAQYGLIAVVVLGDGLVTKELLKQYNLTPSFTSSWRYEKGTIVAVIVDPASARILWRAALQANVDQKQPLEIRQARIREGIRRLFSRLPRESKVENSINKGT